jgi:hypothetical protein
MTSTTKLEPSWRAVKAELESFDRAGLLRLFKDLHEASGDNQAFLNARLRHGAAPLVPCKKMIAPGGDEGGQGQEGAIRDWKVVAELSLFYCEQANRPGVVVRNGGRGDVQASLDRTLWAS